MPDNVKLVEFHTTHRERALRWFIIWSELHKNPTVDEIKKEFV